MGIIAIRSCGKAGKEVLDSLILKEGYGKKELIFVDEDYKKWHTRVFDIEVISVNEFVKRYIDGRIESIVFPESLLRGKLIHSLLNNGVSDSDIYILRKEGNVLRDYKSFTYLRYLEFHVVDHCNLNCKGCDHYSPLVKGQVFVDYVSWSKDIERLKELIESIPLIRIMGGEPLLNTDICRFLRKTRDTYPCAEIHLVTNGILLGSQSPAFWDSLRSNMIEIHLSVYPDLIGNVDNCFKLANGNGVKIHAHDVEGFLPLLRRKPVEPFFQNTEDCICNNLYDGYISSCPYPMFGKYFNAFFGESIPFESGKIDIHDKTLTGRGLMDLLDTPIELCKFCNYPELLFNYRQNVPKWRRYFKNERIDITDFCDV